VGGWKGEERAVEKYTADRRGTLFLVRGDTKPSKKRNLHSTEVHFKKIIRTQPRNWKRMKGEKPIGRVTISLKGVKEWHGGEIKRGTLAGRERVNEIKKRKTIE